MRVQTALHGVAATATFLVLTIALAEISAWVLLRCSISALPARSDILASLEAPGRATVGPSAPAEPDSPEFLRQHILHPYLGFVRNPDLRRQVFSSRVVEEPVNEFGFFGPSPLEAGDANTVAVVITGGSVAADLYLRSSEVLRSELQRSRLLADRRIRVVCLALGGMKQPQQLLALAYFLSLGASFDVVINLDGFNEIALPFAENVPAGFPVSFPRSWQLYTGRIADDRSAMLLTRMSEKRGQIERARGLFSREPFRHSSLCLLLWDRLHGRLRSELLVLEKQLRELTPRSEQAGHPSRTRPLEEVLVEATALWKRSSIQMWKLCRSNRSVYVHVLQPNQYLAGSKPLDARERRVALAPPDFAYRRAAERGYPLLIAAGGELKRLGVPFRDLTRIFETEKGTIYVDSCCHYDQRGNDMLAAEIARFVVASIENAGISLPEPRGETEAPPTS
jgi:hypothetical protein